MRESAIMAHTKRMQGYVDNADYSVDCVYLMEDGLFARGVEPSIEAPFIPNRRNRLRYLWAKHGGFALIDAKEL